MPSLEVLASSQELAARAAILTVDALIETIKTDGEASFVLAGGCLPPRAYEIIAREYATALDWRKVTFLIGDERCVPLDDTEANWPAAIPMLDTLGVSDSQRLRPRSDLQAEVAAAEYESTLLQKLGRSESSGLKMSLLWLGMGEDGHTLSLFPNHPSMSITDALVIPVHNSPKSPPNRISLTLAAVVGAKKCVALINNSGKASVVAKILAGDESFPIIKASRAIEAADGSVTWLLDADAAAAAESPLPEAF
jgi:6-phosphogluconolactonase